MNQIENFSFLKSDGLIKKSVDILKFRYVTILYELEAFLLRRDIHNFKVLNNYILKIILSYR